MQVRISVVDCLRRRLSGRRRGTYATLLGFHAINLSLSMLASGKPYLRSISVDCVERCVRQLSLRLLSGSISLATLPSLRELASVLRVGLDISFGILA